MKPIKVAIVVLLAVSAALLVSGPRSVTVAPGDSVSRVAQRVRAGTTVVLLPGLHDGFEVTNRVSVEGRAGAIVRGPVVVSADRVRLSRLTVTGGESGVTVHEADEVVLEQIAVAGAAMHGIEVIDGSARIVGCRINALSSPFAQAVEVRNSNGRPRTVVEGCVVIGGQEGLVSHVSRVEFRGNRVSATTLRGIVVTEMSEGLAERNLVLGVAGSGLYCGDMSHCEFRNNTVRGVSQGSAGVRPQAGYGVVAWFESTMRLRDNVFRDTAAGSVGLFLHSNVTERFPLSVWPAGWRGALPAVWIMIGVLAALALVRVAVEPVSRALRRRARRESDAQRVLLVLAAGLAVQSFHLLEHAVQVFQVHVADAPERAGLLGSFLDVEWVHLVYNSAVLFFLAWLVVALVRVRPGLTNGLGFALATVFVQGYHMSEHIAKFTQHLRTGIDPAPGLFGAGPGLVWFHFGINFAVWAGQFIVLAVIWSAVPHAWTRVRSFATDRASHASRPHLRAS